MSETVGEYMCTRFNCQTKNKGQYWHFTSLLQLFDIPVCFNEQNNKMLWSEKHRDEIQTAYCCSFFFTYFEGLKPEVKKCLKR